MLIPPKAVTYSQEIRAGSLGSSMGTLCLWSMIFFVLNDLDNSL